MADPKVRREVGRWRILAFLLILIALALLVVIIILLVKFHTDQNKISTCGSPDKSKYGHVDLKESATPSVFHDLTSNEINGLMTSRLTFGSAMLAPEILHNCNL
jgi:uncharacterized protein YpmS